MELLPIPTLPLVGPGDDLAALVDEAIRAAGVVLTDGDVVVVTGKVVSKAEGRLVDLGTVTPSARANRLAELTEKDPRLVELILRESVGVVRARPGTMIVRHRRGYVSAAAGIDRSNIGGDDEFALLLPEDPDHSARLIRDRLSATSAVSLGVVITDSHGRPFRMGNTGIAIGCAGVVALRSLEGRPDLFGRLLSGASIVPVADLIASAAMLVSGEAAEGVAVVVARGVPDALGDATSDELIRPADRDMFAIPDRDYFED